MTDEGHEMSDELVALLRHRVATGYYDQPQVLAAVARAIARLPSQG